MTWRNVLGMVILVGVCALALFWAQGGGDAPDRGPATLFEPFDKNDVTALTVTGESGALELRRRPDDSELWDLEVGVEWARADAIAVDEILGALVRCDVRRSFPVEGLTATDVANYGLAAPALTVVLQLPGSERTARFGARSPEGANVYADRGANATVMVVSTTAADELAAALRSGLRDKRITDLRPYDMKGIEIARGGVTTLEAERDVTQIWRVTQPFKGYAAPVRFDTRIAQIVNEQWLRVAEDGAQDLARYGLARPAAEVTLTSKRGATRVLTLGAEPGVDGNWFVVEQGYHSVYQVSTRFAEAVLADAAEFRDRIFTRLGFGIESVTVNVGGISWVLRKAYKDWEIEKPAREPAEESVVEGFLEQLRQWPILEFLDGEDAAAYGVAPDGDQIQVEREGGSLVTFLIGKEAADGNRYAQRKDDGALVLVLGAPVRRVLDGWLQFKRRAAFDIALDDVEFIGREAGFGPDGEASTDEKWRRDLDGRDKSWKPQLGEPGAGLDSEAMNRMLAALRSIKALGWHHLDSANAEEMGFRKEGGKAATAWFEIGFRSSDADVFLEIGARVPGRDAFYAKQRGKPFVFEMAADVVATLTAPLLAQE